MLKSFFGRTQNMRLEMSAIRMYETEKFKAISNYLRKRTTKATDKNIEFVAWLIDFQYRPYHVYNQYVNMLEEANIEADDTLTDKENKTLSLKNSWKLSLINNMKRRRPTVSISCFDALNAEQTENNARSLVIEYPTGVKIHVDAYNLDLISSLVRI